MSPHDSSERSGARRHPYAYWPGLLAAPLLFLVYQSIAYAIVPWACSSQRHVVLHVVSTVAFGVLVLMLIAGLRDRRRDHRNAATDREDPLANRRRLLADVATAVNGLSLLAMLALWFTQFVIGPCVP